MHETIVMVRDARRDTISWSQWQQEEELCYIS